MSAVLTGPFLAAAGLLCVSGAAKLRRPAPAVRALSTLGIVSGPGLVRLLAALELTGGAAAVLIAGRASAIALAGVYAGFAGLTGALARKRAACGCFGSDEAPASTAQLALSVTLAGLGVACTIWRPAGLGWVLGHSPAYSLVLLVGIGGCLYALANAYTQLPAAFAAWSGR